MTSIDADLFQAYVNRLRVHAHWLIAEGYARMDNAAFAGEEEPAITGELVREMRAYLESGDGAPPWVCYYSIHDDPPLSVGGRLGKARPRVDIEFERMARGPRPRLRFEAKRLDSTTGHTVSGYLGRDGLGCFLCGRYPMTHGEAGMLGYVQSEDETIWVERIESALSRDREGLAVRDPLLSHQRVHPALHHTYCSRRSRDTDEAPVVVHHVLLRFGASGGRASREPSVVPSQTEPGQRRSNPKRGPGHSCHVAALGSHRGHAGGARLRSPDGGPRETGEKRRLVVWAVSRSDHRVRAVIGDIVSQVNFVTLLPPRVLLNPGKDVTQIRGLLGRTCLSRHAAGGPLVNKRADGLPWVSAFRLDFALR